MSPGTFSPWSLLRLLQHAALLVATALHVGVIVGQTVEELRSRAEQGDASAQSYLGMKYDYGQGVPQDYAEAVKWYRLAAEQGDAFAQFNLALMYDLGEGVPQDYARAHKWFNLAASRASAEKNKVYASARDQVAGKMTPTQIAEAQRLAREWKRKTWD